MNLTRPFRAFLVGAFLFAGAGLGAYSLELRGTPPAGQWLVLSDGKQWDVIPVSSDLGLRVEQIQSPELEKVRLDHEIARLRAERDHLHLSIVSQQRLLFEMEERIRGLLQGLRANFTGESQPAQKTPPEPGPEIRREAFRQTLIRAED
jgi:hypothetical protein